MLPKSNRDMNDERVPRDIDCSRNPSFYFNEIMEDNSKYLEKIQFTIENLEFLISNFNTKILLWWKIGGLIGLGLLMIIGYIFCTTTTHLVVLGFTGLFLLCGWMVGKYIIQRKAVQSFNFTLEYKELGNLKLYISDMFLTEAIEIKAKGSYSRDRLSEIKTLCELLKTSEGIEKAISILKALDLNLNDIQWLEGTSTGIKISE